MQNQPISTTLISTCTCSTARARIKLARRCSKSTVSNSLPTNTRSSNKSVSTSTVCSAIFAWHQTPSHLRILALIFYLHDFMRLELLIAAEGFLRLYDAMPPWLTQSQPHPPVTRTLITAMQSRPLHARSAICATAKLVNWTTIAFCTINHLLLADFCRQTSPQLERWYPEPTQNSSLFAIMSFLTVFGL